MNKSFLLKFSNNENCKKTEKSRRRVSKTLAAATAEEPIYVYSENI